MAVGEKAMVILYGGKETDVLDTMRHRRFVLTVSKKAIHPNMLPPTCTAAKYHSLRVFHRAKFGKGILSMLKSRAGKIVTVGWYHGTNQYI